MITSLFSMLVFGAFRLEEMSSCDPSDHHTFQIVCADSSGMPMRTDSLAAEKITKCLSSVLNASEQEKRCWREVFSLSETDLTKFMLSILIYYTNLGCQSSEQTLSSYTYSRHRDKNVSFSSGCLSRLALLQTDFRADETSCADLLPQRDLVPNFVELYFSIRGAALPDRPSEELFYALQSEQRLYQFFTNTTHRVFVPRPGARNKERPTILPQEQGEWSLAAIITERISAVLTVDWFADKQKSRSGLAQTQKEKAL